jgi:transcriptional regulator with XRE-family HTH domain
MVCGISITRGRAPMIRGQRQSSDGPGLFAVLLRQHRLAASLSQEELAQRAGLSRRGICDLERGARRAPHPTTLRLLMNALNLKQSDQERLLVAATAPCCGSLDPTDGEQKWDALRKLVLVWNDDVGGPRVGLEIVALFLQGAAGYSLTRAFDATDAKSPTDADRGVRRGVASATSPWRHTHTERNWRPLRRAHASRLRGLTRHRPG